MSEITNERPVNTGGRPGGMGRPGGIGAPVEKSKNFKATWGKLIRYCKSYTPAILFALIAAVSGTVLQVLGPNKLKDITNEITKGLPALINGKPVVGSIDLHAVGNIAWVLAIFYAGSALLSFAQSFTMTTVTQGISKSLRADISGKINRLPLKYFDNYK